MPKRKNSLSPNRNLRKATMKIKGYTPAQGGGAEKPPRLTKGAPSAKKAGRRNMKSVEKY